MAHILRACAPRLMRARAVKPKRLVQKHIDRTQKQPTRRTTRNKCTVSLMPVHEPGDHNPDRRVRKKQRQGNKNIPENVDADVKEGHEESKALEDITNEEDTDSARILRWYHLQCVESNNTDQHHRKDQEGPCGCERFDVVFLVEPYHQHWEADDHRSCDIDPKENVYSAWMNVTSGNSVVDSYKEWLSFVRSKRTTDVLPMMIVASERTIKGTKTLLTGSVIRRSDCLGYTTDCMIST